MYNLIIEKIKDKNICILGFGMEGISTYKFIRRHLIDKKLTIIDKKDISNLEVLKSDKNLEIIYGEDYLNNLNKYDLIIKSPGISLKNINIDKFKDKITSQVELLLEIYKNNVIGITGTKGKSTTSSLLYKILKDQKDNVYLLGNIAIPIFDYIEEFNEKSILIVEMSAHQLEFINISPHISILLNLFEDHLDHSGTVEHYHENKMNIFKYQNKDDIAIYTADDINILKLLSNNYYNGEKYKVTLKNSDSKNTIYLDGDNIMLDNDIVCKKNIERNILGDHNLLNIMFCMVISKLFNLNIEKVKNSIKEFIPLEHRMELVGTFDDVTFYNDTIATIPIATINAIETLKDVDTLIFGGMDRGIDYTEFINYLEKCNVSNLICMPSTGYKIGKNLEEKNINKSIYYIELLSDAVKKAKEVTKKGKICLLSPAASSYEYFKNFEEKGKMFKQYIKGE